MIPLNYHAEDINSLTIVFITLWTQDMEISAVSASHLACPKAGCVSRGLKRGYLDSLRSFRLHKAHLGWSI
jgi:hypothetical protein